MTTLITKLDALHALTVAPFFIACALLIVLACVLAHYADRVLDRAAERVCPTPRALRGGRR